MTACGCAYARWRRAGHMRFLRATALAFGGFLAGVAVLVGLRAVGVVGRELVLWLLPTLLVLAMILYVELARATRPALPWRQLQTGDFGQALTFPGLTFVGWLDVVGDELAGWRGVLFAAGSTVVVCVVAYEFVLRVPPMVAEFRRKAFGSLTEENRRFVGDFRRHELFCRAPDERGKARIRVRARAAAVRRRATRRAGSREAAIYRWLDKRVLEPYEDIALWFSMYTVSAAVFALLFPRVEPGLWSTVLIFLPFALMPVLAFVWQKIKARSTG